MPNTREYLTTREVAEMLRIKERKVYDLAASGEIPCSRAMGKLLFPRAAVESWIASNSSGAAPMRAQMRPNVVLGSHDPLLDWSLRESRCGLATYLDGSLDGLDRFERAEGIAAGLHLFDPGTESWNVGDVERRFAEQPVVLIEWCWRERGLIVASERAGRVTSLADLAGLRIVPRQREAGSQRLLLHLLAREGLTDKVGLIETVRTETEAALAVLDQRADAAFGLAALASQYRLGFAGIVRERYDLLVDRRAFFDAPWQMFLAFCRSPTFAAHVQGMAGYDVAGLGTVHFNGG